MPASIFAGSKVKTLKNTLSLNGGADVISSTTDPTSSAVSAEPGSLLLNTTSGKLYRKNDSGSSTNWSEVGSGGAGINYITNPNAATNTTGWTTYADAAGSAPVDGAGGSPNVTFSRSTSTPLRGSADFNFVKDAANRQGEGVATDLTIDLADQAKVLQVSFDYEVLSGTYASGDLTIYLIADPAGTPVVIQPAGYQIVAGTVGTKLTARATFQTQASGQSYRLCLHVASTSALAYTLAIDNVVVGPQITAAGAAVTDWQSVSISTTWNAAASTSAATYRRVGDSLQVNGNLVLSGAPTGNFTVTLPLGLSIDTAKIPTGSLQTVGHLAIDDFAVGMHLAAAVVSGANTINFIGDDGAGTTSPTVPITVGTSDSLKYNFTVPIVGWSSNTVMSNDSDTRVVAASYQNTSATTTVGTSSTGMTFNLRVVDTHASFNGTTFTVPVSGTYKIQLSNLYNVTAVTTAGQIDTQIYVDSVLSSFTRSPFISATGFISGSTVFERNLNAGQLVTFAAQKVGGSFTANQHSDGTAAQISIERLSGPAQIAASETVAARYTTTGNTIASGGTGTVVTFANKDYDTHNFFNGATGVATIPVSGKYRVSAAVYFAGASFTAVPKHILARVNSTGKAFLVIYGSAAFTNSFGINGGTELQLNAGDTVDFQVATNESGTRNLDTLANASYMSIVRVGN